MEATETQGAQPLQSSGGGRPKVTKWVESFWLDVLMCRTAPGLLCMVTQANMVSVLLFPTYMFEGEIEMSNLKRNRLLREGRWDCLLMPRGFRP